MAALFSTIARNHSVTSEQVREYLVRRRTSLDAAVILSFAVLYWFVADRLARRMCRRFPFEGGWPGALVSIVATSIAVSIIGVLLGEQWSIMVESIRLGTGHLSDRTFRIPWVQHRMQLFAAGVFLFWLAAALRYKVSHPRQSSGI